MVSDPRLMIALAVPLEVEEDGEQAQIARQMIAGSHWNARRMTQL